MKKKTLSTEKIQLEESYNAIKQWDNNIIEIIENLCELVENLSGSYKSGNDAKKWKIIRTMQCEFIINNKKELVIKENKLFEIIKSLNFQDWYSKQRQMQTISVLYDYTAKNQESASKIINDLKDIILV